MKESHRIRDRKVEASRMAKVRDAALLFGRLNEPFCAVDLYSFVYGRTASEPNRPGSRAGGIGRVLNVMVQEGRLVRDSRGIYSIAPAKVRAAGLAGSSINPPTKAQRMAGHARTARPAPQVGGAAHGGPRIGGQP